MIVKIDTNKEWVVESSGYTTGKEREIAWIMFYDAMEVTLKKELLLGKGIKLVPLNR